MIDRPCPCGGTLLYFGKWTQLPTPKMAHKWLCRACNKIVAEEITDAPR